MITDGGTESPKIERLQHHFNGGGDKRHIAQQQKIEVSLAVA